MLNLSKIKSELDRIDGWTDDAQAVAMATVILLNRVAISVEIGVWHGKGLVALALAHQQLGFGTAIGIDPYHAQHSIKGQVEQVDQEWWSKANHNVAEALARKHLKRLDLERWAIIHRMTSDEFDPPEGIGLLRIDGNHGEQVLKDIERYCPKCSTGAVLFLDDLDWSGGAVERALIRLLGSRSWRQIARVDKGAVLVKL